MHVFVGNEGRYFSILNDTLSNRNLLSKMEPPVLKYENIPGTDVSYAGKCLLFKHYIIYISYTSL